MAGIATNPVEGRWGAALWGYDAGNGIGDYQAGMWGGDPNVYINPIAIPNQELRRVALGSLVRDEPQELRRVGNTAFVRKP